MSGSVPALRIGDLVGALLFCDFYVDILKREHVDQLLLCPCREAAPISKLRSVLVSTEHTIPHRQVGEVVLVDVILVVNRMQLWCLYEESEPGGVRTLA